MPSVLDNRKDREKGLSETLCSECPRLSVPGRSKCPEHLKDARQRREEAKERDFCGDVISESWERKGGWTL